MLEEIKKGLLASFGAVLLSKEKIEEITRRMVSEAKLTEEEARRLRDEMIKAGEQQYEKMESAVSHTFQRGVGNMGFATQDEFQKLKQRVDNLEIRLAGLEKSDSSE